MPSSCVSAVVLVPAVLWAGCATSNANKVCSPAQSWMAPATTCVAKAPPPPPEPEPVAVPAPVATPPPRKAEVKGERIELKETVYFQTGSAQLSGRARNGTAHDKRAPETARVHVCSPPGCVWCNLIASAHRWLSSRAG